MKEVPDPEQYILKDKDNEKRFGLKLEDSIRRAQENRGQLLSGIPIYCTVGIKNGTESYQAIAEANGAIFMSYGPKSGSTIRVTNPEDDEGGPDPVYLLSTSTPEEKKLWKRFEEMARRGNMEPRVVASDWLLDVVMKQEVSFDKKYLVTNFFA
ncbi:putative brca1 c terminus domain-containing protein [Rosellinia necatrix]|uniref:Putative brca1 c terminus domain-containing protein n=1 Tax=Rosellinia necatrix TaxID=77044 RepID=A0A1S8AA64_ROSNE|nr:putative brca1 c terminus domain-containing protein [Rosellinia necatrix]